MKIVWLVLCWIFCIFFGVLAIITIVLGRLTPAIPLLLIALLLLPPIGKLIQQKTSKLISILVRSIIIVLLLVVYLVLSFITIGNQPLYKSPELKAKLMAIYDSKLKQWPIPYESKYIETIYGKVHVVISGVEDAPPVLLLHAASMSAPSWLHNIESLNEYYRTYAIDYIGEPGKSSLNDMNNFPKDGKALSDLYTNISSKLGVEQAHVIAASFGGFIATNYALYEPERVKKLVLLGPMGITPATSSTNIKLILFMLLPIKPFQDLMVNWALGDNQRVLETWGEWLQLVTSGVNRKGSPPITFTPEQLQSVKVPILLILGEKDQLVGKPEVVRKLALNVPEIQIEVLNTAHLMSAEQPDSVYTLINVFLGVKE